MQASLWDLLREAASDTTLVLLNVAGAVQLALAASGAGPASDYIDGAAILGTVAICVAVSAATNADKEAKFAELSALKDDVTVRGCVGVCVWVGGGCVAVSAATNADKEAKFAALSALKDDITVRGCVGVVVWVGAGCVSECVSGWCWRRAWGGGGRFDCPPLCAPPTFTPPYPSTRLGTHTITHPIHDSPTQVRVVRRGATAGLSVRELLVGDVLRVEAGDIIPADALMFGEGGSVRWVLACGGWVGGMGDVQHWACGQCAAGVEVQGGGQVASHGGRGDGASR